MAKPPISEQVQVNFRMPVELRDQIKAAAGASGRSMNAEIIDRLSQSFDTQMLGLFGAMPRDLMNRIMVAASIKRSTWQDEVKTILLTKYPPPKESENEVFLSAMKQILQSLAEQTDDVEAKNHFEKTIKNFDEADLNITGPLAREFLKTVAERHPKANDPDS